MHIGQLGNENSALYLHNDLHALPIHLSDEFRRLQAAEMIISKGEKVPARANRTDIAKWRELGVQCYGFG
jgi:hypothetical protein